VRSCSLLCQSLSRRTTPCRISAIAYLIYSQLPSISGGRLLHPQPEDAPCRGNICTHNMAKWRRDENWQKYETRFVLGGKRAVPEGVLAVTCTIRFLSISISWWSRTHAKHKPMLSAQFKQTRERKQTHYVTNVCAISEVEHSPRIQNSVPTEIFH
jgi:hypothetical protein